ncbi:GAF domain-containing protein [Thorsellia kenyensis]|uniref:GAF domain-containing protein n=1 Tax=Thorsellia kenyensis TaxID=1549888 RepID=A0ABV6CGC0_9GAMM
MTRYSVLKSELNALIAEETNPLIIMCNSSALLKEHLTNINWLGFYLVNNSLGVLTLGPFQGKIACTRIPKSEGVCGTAWATNTVQNIPDVHLFEGHIACDSASESEIVIPLYYEIDGKKECFAVLDIDSPIKARFSEEDEKNLIEIAELISRALANAEIEILLNVLS